MGTTALKELLDSQRRAIAGKLAEPFERMRATPASGPCRTVPPDSSSYPSDRPRLAACWTCAGMSSPTNAL